MTTFFGIIGMLGSAVCAAWLIIQWIRKQPKKLPLICLAASLVLMVLCASIETENDKTREKHAVAVYEAISSAEKAAMPEETQTRRRKRKRRRRKRKRRSRQQRQIIYPTSALLQWR